MRLLLSFHLFCFLFFTTQAQNGWDSIKRNNTKEAKAIFLSKLESDSLHKSSLEGMIYIAELEEDEDSYDKYINRLINNHPEEHTFRVFSNRYSWNNPEKIVNNSTFSRQSKLSAYYNLATELWEKRKFEEAKKTLNEHVGKFNWTLIGPFKNPNGSGHIESYEPEITSFSKSQTYSNEDYNLQWVYPSFMDWTNEVEFQDHLNEDMQGSVYYANTFLTFSKEEWVEFRLARIMPVKLWIDDDLVYESNERIGSLWDNEIIRLKIAKGTHRVLLKSSDYSGYTEGYDLFSFKDYNQFGSYQNASFVLRVTDTLGNSLQHIQSVIESDYQKIDYSPEITTFPISNYFLKQVEENPEDLFLYYLLCKAFQLEGRVLDAEAYFVKQHQKHPDLVFYKHLLAKCYSKNGKIERAYEVMNGIDYTKTPLFDLLYEKFNELDMEHDEEEWLAKLEQLKSITPSNYSVIQSYIRYYEIKGMQDEKEDFIKRMIKKYPQYEYRLNYELEKSNKPKKHFTDKEKQKNIKEAQSDMRKYFIVSQYEALIDYYLDRDNKNKVEDLYEELIQVRPYMVHHRTDLAEFYYQNEAYENALSQLQQTLAIAPYESEVHELMGDIYYDQKKNEQALTSYIKAKRYTSNTYTRQLETKIEKITGQRKLKSLFTTRSFEEVLAEDSVWSKKYVDKDAIVLMYTRDIAVDSSSRIEAFQKMMVKVLTKAGADSWTEFNSNFLGNLSTVKVIKTNGSVVRPDVSGSYVVCKNLEPGDVIQLEGHTKSNWKGELGKEIYLVNYFSFQSPIYYSKLEFSVPKEMKLSYVGNKLNAIPKQSVDSASHNHYVWEFNYVNELVKEEAIIDNLDTYSYIMVSSMHDWSPIVDWYEAKTYRLLESGYEIEAILDSVIAPQMSDQQKVLAVYNYITEEIKYSYVPFLQSNFVPKRCPLTCASKIGDCKDVATLMITMLRELGIEAYYVLVKTSHMSSGDIVPSLYFDHVIVGYVLDGEMYSADLTTDFYPYYVLTDIDVNQVGLVIREGENQVFRLPADNVNPEKNKIEVKIKAKLYEDRSVDLTISASYPGMAGGFIREQFSKFTEDEKMNYIIENLGNGVYNHLELESYEFQNLNNLENPLLATYKAKALGFANFFLDYMTFRVPFETAVEYSSVMSSKTRQSGLDIAQITSVSPTEQTIDVEIPSGYKLAQLPKAISIKSEFGEYRMSFKKTDEGIQIVKYQQFNQQHLKAEQFNDFKDFYLKILDADALLIPLKRK